MNSISENNNNLLIASSKMAASNIDVNNVNAIWKNNFNNNNNNTRDTMREMDEAHTKISWGALNNNNNMQENDKDSVKNGHDSDNSNSTESNGKLVEVDDVRQDGGHDGNEGNDEVLPSPSHHARRPMNAFLIFCKKHRPIVRQKFPTLENRGVTRILGEWWSLLDFKDKEPHTKLAKEYKDAFFNANPDFKWYKLPAPPLRTLPTRPNKLECSTSPVNTFPSPTSSVANMNASQVSGDFTPGKLADESQLGMLSSLFNSNSYKKHKTDENLNNQEEVSDKTPVFKERELEPPKPLKKRLAAEMDKGDNSKHVRNLFEQETPEIPPVQAETRQEVTSDESLDLGTNGRKSFRKGKGNRYADIMASGKLIKNKRASVEKSDKLPATDVSNQQTNKLELNSTIKKLQERLQNTTNKVEVIKDVVEKHLNNEANKVVNDVSIEKIGRIRTISEVSEMSDMADYSKAIPSFDLESRIAQLPNLSYDTYIQRKQERRKLPKGGKKTKKKQVQGQNHEIRKRSYNDAFGVETKVEVNIINGRKTDEKQTGSKKRKNKHNITHLKDLKTVTQIQEVRYIESDLSGLNALADAALKMSNNNNNRTCDLPHQTNG